MKFSNRWNNPVFFLGLGVQEELAGNQRDSVVLQVHQSARLDFWDSAVQEGAAGSVQSND